MEGKRFSWRDIALAVFCLVAGTGGMLRLHANGVPWWSALLGGLLTALFVLVALIFLALVF